MRWISLLVCALVACGGDDGPTPEPSEPDLLVVAPKDVALERNGTTTLTASYRIATTLSPATDVTWSSSEPSVATIVANGASVTVTAVAPGTSTITATGQELTGTVQLRVAVPRITLVAVSSGTVAAGLDKQLTATATYSDGATADVTAAASWSSNKPQVASVFNGRVHGVATGNAAITATINGVIGSTSFDVTAAQLLSILVTPGNPLVPLGAPQQFTAMGMFSNATMSDITATVMWSSSNVGVATISNTTGTNGRAATVTTGNTTITAMSGTISGTAQLAVAAAALVSITINPATPTVPLSADFPFTAMGTFSDTSMMDVTGQVTWSSSNQAVATMSGNIADAKLAGTSTITASLNTVMDTTLMTVALAPVGSWVADAGFSGSLCPINAVQFTMDSTVVFACTTATGLMKGTVAVDTTITWATSNAGVTNLAGLGIATHPMSPTTMMFMATPAPSVNNWFRSADNGMTMGLTTNFLDSQGGARFLYAGKFQAMVGHMIGSWDPGPAAGSPQAIVMQGNATFPFNTRVVSTATGIVRSIVSSAANNIFVAVFGETPTGAVATGGVFRSTDSSATWAARDTGIAAADRDRVIGVVMDAAGTTLYAAVQGGARVYKTTDTGANWAASASGIPAKAKVAQVYISPANANIVYAATNIGLYKSVNAGAAWTLDGFQGRSIRAIAQSGTAAALILVGVDDAAALYRPM